MDSIQKNISGKVRKKNKSLIFSAAKKEFVEHGFKGASIKRIAERAKIPRSNIHYYFLDKSDLYQQILTDILTLWNSHFDSLCAIHGPKKALSDYIRAKVLFSQKDPDASKIFASEIIHGAPVLKDYLATEFRHWIKQKVLVIEDWISQGLMSPVNPYHLLFLIWSSTQHYADFDTQILAGLNKKNMKNEDFEEVIASLTSIILTGCGVKN